MNMLLPANQGASAPCTSSACCCPKHVLLTAKQQLRSWEGHLHGEGSRGAHHITDTTLRGTPQGKRTHSEKVRSTHEWTFRTPTHWLIETVLTIHASRYFR